MPPPNVANFFLLGTSKGGTTSLHHYLSRHPAVLMSDPKEPSFFRAEYEKGLEYYADRYFHRYSGQKVIGDAAPQHLYLPYVARRIAESIANPRFAVICRNPVDRAVSAYWHNVSRGIETRSFDDVIEQNLKRLAEGPRFETEDEAGLYKDVLINKGNAELQRRFGFYVEPGHYDELIGHYRSIFGNERVKVLFFDDLAADPQRVADQLFAFLDLPSVPLGDARAQNEATSRTAARVFELVGRIPGVASFSPRLRVTVKRLIGRRMRGNSEAKPSIGINAHRQLIEHYRDRNRRLAETTGRDLAHWDHMGP